MVCVVIWLAAVALTTQIAPRLSEGFRSLELSGGRLFAALSEIGDWAWWWGPIVPVGAIVALAVWWTVCRRAAMSPGDRSARLTDRMPWIGRLLRLSRAATFLEILSLLIENEMPLTEAITLAADASGDRQTRSAARRIVERLEEGHNRPKSSRAGDWSPFPPLMGWILCAARRDGALLPALRRGAAAYHQRARRQAEAIRTFAPIVLTILFACSATAAYVFVIFVPYVAMLHSLADLAGK